jgi:hypothetical protein
MARANTELEVMREIFEPAFVCEPAALCNAAGLTRDHPKLVMEVITREGNTDVSPGHQNR